MTAKIIEFDPRRPTPPFNDWIKGLQQHLRKTEGRKTSVEKLIVLHRRNDPFYAGGEADWKYARWFADLFKRLDCQDGIHLRRTTTDCSISKASKTRAA